MKWVLVVAAVVGVAARTIFDYERDGLENEQKGQPGQAVTGEYEWRAPDGKVVEISYVADHLGFRLVDDPEPTATQSGAARSLGEEEEEEKRRGGDDGGAREVRTEEETEEEEGEEESEGRSEGTEEEESESSGKEKSEEPEEGAEAEEKSAEPEAEEAEAEGQEPEAAEAEQGKADAEAEENAGAEGAAKKASEESATADEVEAESEAAGAEAEVAEAGGEPAGKQLSSGTPVLVPVKVESNFDSVSLATEAPVIATAEMLPPVAPLVAPMTVEAPAAPVPSAEVSFDAAHSASANLVPQDLVLFVIPPVEQFVTVPDVSQPAPATAPFASAASALPLEIPQPAFTDSDLVLTEQGSEEPVLLLPELPLALVASPEGTNVVLEKPVFEKVEVSAPIGVPEIDSDIAVIAKSYDSVQAAPQFLATDLSGSFDPVADIPASLSVIPASDTAFVPVENIPKMIRFEEVVEVSPEVALAPELPSPLPLIQLDEVDPSFVSVEIPAAPLPQPDTKPSSLFGADVEVLPEPQFIAPIVPPPSPLSQDDAPFALPPHRFEAPKSGRSMDSVPVFVESSHAEPINALFFVPEALQEESKGLSLETIEIVVPEDSIMTVAKSLVQPPTMPAEPVVYRETEVETVEPLLTQLEFGPAPSPTGAEASQAQGSVSFANSIPLSLKDEILFSAADASPLTLDASPVEITFVEVPAEDPFPALPEAIAQPLTGMQPGAQSAFEEPVLLDVSATAEVQVPEVSAPTVAIFETDAGPEPVFEEVVMISEEPAGAGPRTKVTIITDDAPSDPLDYDDATVLVSKSVQSPPLLPPLMKPSVILN
nr:LOW QUALITY PROTEIN: calphotin-like [Penaeus vannamei]